MKTVHGALDTEITSGRCSTCGELIFYPGWFCWHCLSAGVLIEDDDLEADLDGDALEDWEGDELDDQAEADEVPAEDWDWPKGSLTPNGGCGN